MRPDIDQELRDLIPPLSEAERQALRASIERDGCRSPIIVWDEENLVVDGHNRLAICQELGVDYKVERRSFGTRDDAICWMCENQLARRNLTGIARDDLIGQHYHASKRREGRPKKLCQNDIVSGPTDAAQADTAGVSARTVTRAASLTDSLDALEAAGIDRSAFTDGTRNLRKNHVIELGKIAKVDKARAKRIWGKVEAQGPNNAAIKAAIREVNDEDAVATLPAVDEVDSDLVTIEHGDFRELSLELESESFDAIITDPPYPAEYLDTWDGLAEVAMRVLKPGGWCIAYSGKAHLDEVMRRMLDGGLVYFWQVIFLQTVSPVFHPRAVNTEYKPILLFQKPPLTKPEAYFRDTIKGSRVEKELHEWQQSEDGFQWLIETFTNVGDRILEPFSGGGTCPIVCQQLNRYCVAYEIEQGPYAQSLKRLKDAA